MKSFRQYVSEAKEDLGKLIKQEIKKAGYKVPSDISIKKGRGGYETSYDIIIKNMSIDDNEIRRLTNRFKNISYDERTGEILSGGNTFIHVQYDYSVENKEFERIYKLLEEIKEKCVKAEGSFVDVGKGLQVAIPTGQKEFNIKNNGFYYVYKLNGKQQNENPSFDYTPLWKLLLKVGF